MPGRQDQPPGALCLPLPGAPHPRSPAALQPRSPASPQPTSPQPPCPCSPMSPQPRVPTAPRTPGLVSPQSPSPAAPHPRHRSPTSLQLHVPTAPCPRSSVALGSHGPHSGQGCAKTPTPSLASAAGSWPCPFHHLPHSRRATEMLLEPEPLDDPQWPREDPGASDLPLRPEACAHTRLIPASRAP